MVRSYNILCFLWQFPLTESRKKFLDKHEQGVHLLQNDAVDFMQFSSHLTVHFNHPWKIAPTQATWDHLDPMPSPPTLCTV